MEVDEKMIDVSDEDITKNPKNCQLQSSYCGIHSSKRHVQGCTLFKNLTTDVGHLFNADVEITERELICMRAPVCLNPDDLICGQHRFSLGIYYKASSLCGCFLHLPNSRGKGVEISWPMYKFLKSKDSTFILGSLVCYTCQKKLKSKMREENGSESESESYQPSQSIIEDNEKEIRRVKLDNLTDIFGIDRVRFQLKTDVSRVSNRTLNYLRNVHRTLKEKLTDVFCKLVAPGVEDQLKAVLENGMTEETDSDSTLLHLKESFESCNTQQARISVLTLVPVHYSKKVVSDLFQCSIYEIAKARSICKVYGSCGAENKEKKKYSRLSVEKCKHFIDFLFTSGLLQEVAYGTTSLKLDSGEKMTVSNTILNGIHERAVKEYITHCKEQNYDALGRSSLLLMLNKMKPHTRKKLTGVDSFVVEGVEAFQVS